MEQLVQRPSTNLSDEQWPVVPSHEPAHSHGNEAIDIDMDSVDSVDSVINTDDRPTHGKGSELSPDEVEAAQALEHLRTGM